MKRIALKKTKYVLATLGAFCAAAASAQMPVDRPFSMRGVELGISIDQFREAEIPNDDIRYRDMQSACSNGDGPLAIRVHIDPEDDQAGVVECKWYSNRASTRSSYPMEHWVDIGGSGGWPTFRFIESEGEGELRLFQISFYANNQYHPDILDALTRGYGPAKETITPFKTKAGGEFSSLTSVWNNSLSTIVLVERCAHLERYCLTYKHSELVTHYNDAKEAIAAEAASRI